MSCVMRATSAGMTVVLCAGKLDCFAEFIIGRALRATRMAGNDVACQFFALQQCLFTTLLTSNGLSAAFSVNVRWSQ